MEDKKVNVLSDEDAEAVFGGSNFAYHQNCELCGKSFGSTVPQKYCPKCKKKIKN